MKYELIKASSEQEWRIYHNIRESVLWIAKGRSGYDPTRKE